MSKCSGLRRRRVLRRGCAEVAGAAVGGRVGAGAGADVGTGVGITRGRKKRAVAPENTAAREMYLIVPMASGGDDHAVLLPQFGRRILQVDVRSRLQSWEGVCRTIVLDGNGIGITSTIQGGGPVTPVS